MIVKKVQRSRTRKQVWKRYFIAEMSIKKPHTVRLGNSTLHLKPKTQDKVAGYYQIAFYSDALDRYKAKEKTEADFARYEKLLTLRGIHVFRPRWTKLISVDKKSWRVKVVRKRRSISFKLNIKLIPPKYTTQEFESLSALIKKLERSKHKTSFEDIINWLFKNTASPIEEFLCKWISFNILYQTIFPTYPDKDGVKSFGEKHPKDQNTCKKFVNEHDSTINDLKQLSIKSDSGENYSKKLRYHYKKENYREVWINLLLCIYVVRSKLFHSGEFNDSRLLNGINRMMLDIVRHGIFAIL